jgi:hypothetical protein
VRARATEYCYANKSGGRSEMPGSFISVRSTLIINSTAAGPISPKYDLDKTGG